MNKKRMIIMFALSLVLILGSVSTCFADVTPGTDGEGKTKVYLTADAIDEINVTVTEQVELTNDLDVDATALTSGDPFEIENNSLYQIEYSMIAAPESDWNIFADNAAVFKTYTVDAKNIGLSIGGNDIKNAITDTIDGNEDYSEAITGHIALQSTPISTSQHVADVVVTFGYDI